MQDAASRRFLGFALGLALLAVPAGAEERTAQSLFRIERSKNANVVQYDARVRADGSLDRDEPIDAYWLRLAKDGRRKELSWLHRRAYGFSTRWREDGETLEMKMTAPIGRRLEVVMVDDTYRVRTRIDGRPAWVERIFVQSKERLLLPKVVYIDLRGTDVESGETRSERFVPD
jgi:hypothetical protein